MKPIFITGLPRTGSTLLTNILAQNSNIFVGHGSCPVAPLMRDIKNGWHNLKESQALPITKNYELLEGVLRSVLFGAFENCGKPFFITKNRRWLDLIETLNVILDEKPKFIVCVRSIPEILASLELKHRQTRALGITTQEEQAGVAFLSLQKRCEYFFDASQLLGSAYLLLQDALNKKEFREQLLIVKHEDLTTAPHATLEKIYGFLGMVIFQHDFNNIVQVTQEDDRAHGFYDLHTIKPKVEPVKLKAIDILGKELADHYRQYDALWNGF